MRVLLIDNQISFALNLASTLKKHGYAIEHFANGSEAAQHLFVHHDTYDLVLMDPDLPERSGEDICRACRERGITVPIMVMSERSELYNQIKFLNQGADDFVEKPANEMLIEAKIHALMRRPEHMIMPELIVGSIRMYPAEHKVYVDNEVLQLTAKEFALLEFLMRNPEIVQRREDILDHVWDFHYNSLSNVVDVHVKNIRKKLKEKDGRSYIETVEGVGYRMLNPA